MDWKFISHVFIAVGTLGVVWRLWSTGLYKVLPFFFTTWIFTFCRSIILWNFPPNTSFYYWFWTYTTPLYWIFDGIVVFEIYRLALREYRGIRRLSYWALVCGVILSGLITYFVSPRPAREAGVRGIIRAAKTIGGGVDLALVALTLLAVAFLWYFPIRLNRNFAVHIQIYTAFFLSSAVLDWTIAVYGLRSASLAVAVKPIVTLLMCSLWVLLLRMPSDEQMPIHRFTQDKEKQLLEQLNSMNSNLRGLARK